MGHFSNINLPNNLFAEIIHNDSCPREIIINPYTALTLYIYIYKVLYMYKVLADCFLCLFAMMEPLSKILLQACDLYFSSFVLFVRFSIAA